MRIQNRESVLNVYCRPCECASCVFKTVRVCLMCIFLDHVSTLNVYS